MEVKAAAADVAGICGEAFTAVVVVSDFTVVVTAGVSFAMFDTILVAVVVSVVGSVGGETAGDAVGGVEATGVAAVVVLAESGPVLTVDDSEVFGSTAASEAAETTGVGFTPAGVDDTVPAGGDGAVAVTRVVAHVDRLTEDAVSGAGAELTTSVEKTTGEGEATWGTVWSEAEAGVESWFVFAAGAETSLLVSVASALVDSES